MYKKCEEILNKLESEGKIKISDYQFPPTQELKLKLKDMLDDEVEEKYYLTEKLLQNYMRKFGSKGKLQNENECCDTLQAAMGNGGGNVPILKDMPRVIGGIGEKKSNGGTQWYQQDRIYDNNIGLSISTTAQPYYPDKQWRIRKLTPKECWRLMGFDDEDFEKAAKVNSNSQLYKQAGNSICVPVLIAILNNLLSN